MHVRYPPQNSFFKYCIFFQAFSPAHPVDLDHRSVDNGGRPRENVFGIVRMIVPYGDWHVSPEVDVPVEGTRPSGPIPGSSTDRVVEEHRQEVDQNRALEHEDNQEEYAPWV